MLGHTSICWGLMWGVVEVSKAFRRGASKTVCIASNGMKAAYDFKNQEPIRSLGSLSFSLCSVSPAMAAGASVQSTSKTWRVCSPTLWAEAGNSVLDAVGPETYAFDELVTLLALQQRRAIC
jgi:hypothetical protein